MAKKKVVKKVNVATSFFTMHKHARWLLVVFILASIFFLAVTHNAEVKQETELNHVLLQVSSEAHSFTK